MDLRINFSFEKDRQKVFTVVTRSTSSGSKPATGIISPLTGTKQEKHDKEIGSELRSDLLQSVEKFERVF
jgi:hypothetical protein